MQSEAAALAASPYEIGHLIQGSARLLMVHARAPRVGFYPQEIGIGTAGATTTAGCLRALAASRLYDDAVIGRLLSELLQFQNPESGCFGSADQFTHSFATAKTISTILSIQPNLADDEVRVRPALQCLLRNRDVESKGWGFRHGYSPRNYYTYYAAEAVALAYQNTDDDEYRNMYREQLREALAYVERSQISEGIWTNGDDKQPCAISTLAALSTTRTARAALGDADSISLLPSSRALLEAWFQNPAAWRNFQILERGRAFYIRECFPGNAFLLLRLLGPYDPLVVWCVGWLQRNFVPFNGNALGWPVYGDANDRIVSVWATAEGLLSLAEFREALHGVTEVPSPAGVIARIERKPLQKVNPIDFSLVIGLAALALISADAGLVVLVAWSELKAVWEAGGAATSTQIKDAALSLATPVLILLFLLYQLFQLKRTGRLPWRSYKRTLASLLAKWGWGGKVKDTVAGEDEE
ncbi:MAG: hypothetical protein ABI972_26655 [Acidobacteriota bacterium]